MNSSEGLLRIAKVIRYLGYGIGALCFVAGIANVSGLFQDHRVSLSDLATPFVAGAFFAASGWVAAVKQGAGGCDPRGGRRVLVCHHGDQCRDGLISLSPGSIAQRVIGRTPPRIARLTLDELAHPDIFLL